MDINKLLKFVYEIRLTKGENETEWIGSSITITKPQYVSYYYGVNYTDYRRLFYKDLTDKELMHVMFFHILLDSKKILYHLKRNVEEEFKYEKYKYGFDLTIRDRSICVLIKAISIESNLKFK